jgi:hypothetical protein
MIQTDFINLNLTLDLSKRDEEGIGRFRQVKFMLSKESKDYIIKIKNDN